MPLKSIELKQKIVYKLQTQKAIRSFLFYSLTPFSFFFLFHLFLFHQPPPGGVSAPPPPPGAVALPPPGPGPAPPVGLQKLSLPMTVNLKVRAKVLSEDAQMEAELNYEGDGDYERKFTDSKHANYKVRILTEQLFKTKQIFIFIH